MSEARVAVERFGTRLVRLVQRAGQAQINSEKEKGRSAQLEQMLNVARRADAVNPFPVELDQEVPIL